MSERLTPETDAAEVPVEDLTQRWAVHSDFARRLERERDEARERIKELEAELSEVKKAGMELVLELMPKGKR